MRGDIVFEGAAYLTHVELFPLTRGIKGLCWRHLRAPGVQSALMHSCLHKMTNCGYFAQNVAQAGVSYTLKRRSSGTSSLPGLVLFQR